jgi:hypothetical protein
LDRILLVTAGLPDKDALTLIRSGVAGIFDKHHAPEALHRCIREVAHGRMLIEHEYLRELIAVATDSRGGGPSPDGERSNDPAVSSRRAGEQGDRGAASRLRECCESLASIAFRNALEKYSDCLQEDE